ncbi:hypothetical protein [Vibrio algicola]|uniref:Uracil-DNA glycosylase-like domain-containing protein n=1 Tax=Vibrio algicola TaxID=2662262 RepID=A0A5Q0TG44_9VIBR|nr:hypothetical protein [Vibrio algicola]
MSNVFFRPWIGEHFNNENSLFDNKILVLGDSHYCEDGDLEQGTKSSSDLTTEVMTVYLDQNQTASWKGTYSKFMNSFIANSQLTNQSRSNLWNSVAFYNYLQVSAGTGARQTHHYSYAESKHQSALLEIINELQPDVIISWGNKVWDAIPDDFGYGRYSDNPIFDNCCCVYPFKNKEIKLIGITHPSTSYDSSYWSNVFNELGVNT